ncbi:hypothetical protein [Ferroplasma sp. Type II]|nr:hypothetical protein [Ferroplasma sp. Type II]
MKVNDALNQNFILKSFNISIERIKYKMEESHTIKCSSMVVKA